MSGWKRRMVAAERERDAALAVIKKAPHSANCVSTWTKGKSDCDCWKSTVSALAVRGAELTAERDAALAVIAEVREALTPGRPVYASLGAARAALEKVAR